MCPLCWADGPSGRSLTVPSRAVLAVIPPVILGSEADPSQPPGSSHQLKKDLKMLASYSACLFWGVCTTLLAVALAYYFYW